MLEKPLIEFRDVTKRFGPVIVLDRINLKIFEGQVTTIIGLSGSGKTLLLRHIIGLTRPDEGKIFFRGIPVASMKKKEMAGYFARMSYMFQSNALFDSLTVYDNVALPLRETTGLSEQEINRRVMARLEQTQLADSVLKYPSELSGGMQKRVALARALITDPQIVLFDEPTTGQDPVRKNIILGMVAEYHRKFGFTAILVSHAIPDVYFISNRILVLHNGRIVFQGTPEQLDQFDHPFKNEVIGSLEGLQEELTGLYSRRQFKVRYQSELKRRALEETYVVVVFTLQDLESFISGPHYEAAQETLRCLGAYIDKHFGTVGGFSTRREVNEFLTVLPYSNLGEAQAILKDFSRDFQRRGVQEIQACLREAANEAPFGFTLLAGLAEGQPASELDAAIESARRTQIKVAETNRAHRGP